MKTRLVGDIHANFCNYKQIVQPVERSIQLGDFGFGFFDYDCHQEVASYFQNHPHHHFIRGNHDCPEICEAQPNFIQSGIHHDFPNMFFVNGAWSIDRDFRTPGYDWWSNEEHSYRQLEHLIEQYAHVKPDVMISHDCPTIVAYHMFVRNGQSIGGKALYLSRTGEALQQMFEIHQPKFWFFGHWHMTKSFEMNGTQFQCLGIDDFVDFDFENV
jgi:hypothetical protein